MKKLDLFVGIFCKWSKLLQLKESLNTQLENKESFGDEQSYAESVTTLFPKFPKLKETLKSGTYIFSWLLFS